MSHPIGLILPFITAVVIITQSEAATSFTVFSAEQPAIPTVSTAGSLVPGKSKIDCAVRCAVVDYFDCAATVYLPESNSCLQSVLKQASSAPYRQTPSYFVERPTSRYHSASSRAARTAV
uniref:Apple domain-containing protein n=1 Tax=Macrostomum lignano TaxID=282301 RepID=A0A1I8FW30_9PLAT